VKSIQFEKYPLLSSIFPFL